jgi:hypothetical protein
MRAGGGGLRRDATCLRPDRGELLGAADGPAGGPIDLAVVGVDKQADRPAAAHGIQGKDWNRQFMPVDDTAAALGGFRTLDARTLDEWFAPETDTRLSEVRPPTADVHLPEWAVSVHD